MKGGEIERKAEGSGETAMRVCVCVCVCVNGRAVSNCICSRERAEWGTG